jgi:hypothetical protein
MVSHPMPQLLFGATILLTTALLLSFYLPTRLEANGDAVRAQSIKVGNFPDKLKLVSQSITTTR